MDLPVQSVASSLTALNERYQTVTQNLSNVNVIGHKKKHTAFAQTLTAQMNGPQSVLEGQVVDRAGIDFTQGSFTNTGQMFDLAIDGKGFFAIETPRGPLYTRNGSFRLNGLGQLVDHAGRTVAGEGGPITIPPTVSTQKVNISGDGEVFAGGVSVGKVKLVEFANESALTPVGSSLFSAAGQAPAAAQNATVRQGYQEMSNVNVVQELVDLITVTRLYEANLKNVQVQDERLKNLLGVAMR